MDPTVNETAGMKGIIDSRVIKVVADPSPLKNPDKDSEATNLSFKIYK